jgi:hypothetical protein
VLMRQYKVLLNKNTTGRFTKTSWETKTRTIVAMFICHP